MNDYRILRSQAGDQLEWDVINVMWEKVDFYQDEETLNRTLEGATRGQRAIYSCTWYVAEVNNGGHHQFFWNSTGALWEEALRGFNTLAANDYQSILQSAVSLFPGPQPSKHRDERWEQLEQVDTAKLDKLDSEIYALEGRQQLDEIFKNYISAHPDEFFRDP